MAQWIITLESEEFGSEEFAYRTQKEALAGKKRLDKSAHKQWLVDNISRSTTMEVV